MLTKIEDTANALETLVQAAWDDMLAESAAFRYLLDNHPDAAMIVRESFNLGWLAGRKQIMEGMYNARNR